MNRQLQRLLVAVTAVLILCTTKRAAAWQWVPFAGALCRDGSSTGIAVDRTPHAEGLVIFLEEGGACWDVESCAKNRPSFNEDDFKARLDTQLTYGVFNRKDKSNPLRHWDIVFIPYCTGDWHAGNNDAVIEGVGPQTYRGYVNQAQYLAWITTKFTPSHVLLTGTSAGGFGAALTYRQVAQAFPGVRVDMVDDSGPWMNPEQLASCMWDAWVETFGYEHTILEWPAYDYPSTVGLSMWLYPDAHFGLMDSQDDCVISLYFGWGQDSCSGTTALSPAAFESGEIQIAEQFAWARNFSSFWFAGSRHTSLDSTEALDGTNSTAGVSMTTWLLNLLGDGT